MISYEPKSRDDIGMLHIAVLCIYVAWSRNEKGIAVNAIIQHPQSNR
jgi:hypothetical protein